MRAPEGDTGRTASPDTGAEGWVGAPARFLNARPAKGYDEPSPAGGIPPRLGQPAGVKAMAETENNVDRELFRNMEKLRQLRIEHRDLDEVISRLSLDMHIDELQLKRLKKRKLMLKDQITRLESELIPDLNA
jgi:hypothetical protein